MKHLKLFEAFFVETPGDEEVDLDEVLIDSGLKIRDEVSLENIPVSQISYSEWNSLGTSPSKVKELSKVPAEKLPPIIVWKNQENGNLETINGAHRLDAAKERGDETIKSILISDELYQILINYGDTTLEDYLQYKLNVSKR